MCIDDICCRSHIVQKGRYCHGIYFASQISNCSIFLFYLFSIFLLFALNRNYYTHMYFKCYCKLQNLVLLYYAFDYTPRLSFVISSIGMPCFFAISPLGILAWPPSCDQHLSPCMFLYFAGLLCRIYPTNSNSCCYTSSPPDPLATAVFVSCLMHIIALFFGFYADGQH